MLRTFVLSFVFSCFLLVSCGGGGGGVEQGGSSGTPSGGTLSPFGVTATPSQTLLAPGSTIDVVVRAGSPTGGAGDVQIAFTNLPPGVTVTPSTFTMQVAPTGGIQTVTVSATQSAQRGTFTPSVNAQGGGRSADATFSFNIHDLHSFFVTTLTNIAAVRPNLEYTTDLSLTTTSSDENGFFVSLTATGLPPGVTASFSPNPAKIGSPVPTTVTLKAAAGTPVVRNAPIQIVATRQLDAVQASRQLFVTVGENLGQAPDTRHDFLPLEGQGYAGVFDPIHRLLFISDEEWNRIDIVSVNSKTVVKQISVPSPAGMDLSLDGSKVFVGTFTRKLITIDTGTLEVSETRTLPILDPSNPASVVLQPMQLVNGEFFILARDLSSFTTGLVRWDPSTNVVSPGPLGFGVTQALKSTDGTRVLMVKGSSTVALYDVASDSYTSSDFTGNPLIVGISPDGTQSLVRGFPTTGEGGLGAYDANLNLVAMLPDPIRHSEVHGAIYSADGSKWYGLVRPSFSNRPRVVTINASDVSVLSSGPAVSPRDAFISASAFAAKPIGSDSSGLVFAIASHGVTFEDAAYNVDLDTAGTSGDASVLTPNFGKLNTTTPVQFFGSLFYFPPDVWFGASRGNNPSVADNPGPLTVSAPASGVPGSVNVKAIFPNGEMIFLGQGFSYGPRILKVVGDMSSPGGGGTAQVMTLGVPTDPAEVQVFVGGNVAQVKSVTKFAYRSQPVIAVEYVVPPGVPGHVDITITTAAGSATAAKAMQYVQAVNDYGTGNKYLSATFDRFRNQVYLTLRDRIDVFSLASRTFKAPITVSTLNGFTQLGGTGLSVDGSRLVITNIGDGSVAIVDPDFPSSSMLVSVTPPTVAADFECATGPISVAVAANGKAVVAIGSARGITCVPPAIPVFLSGNLRYVDITSGSIAAAPANSFACDGQGASATSDGLKVLVGDCLYDAATDSTTVVKETWISADGNALFNGSPSSAPQRLSYVAEPDGSIRTYLARPITMFSQVGLGPFEVFQQSKSNANGSLSYETQTKQVDISELQYGMPRRRLVLKQTIQSVIDPSAINVDGSQLFLLTDSGLTVVDIQQLPLAIGSISAASGLPGDTITVHGSGFTAGTNATVRSVSALTTFVDSSTIKVVIPPLSSGPAALILVEGSDSFKMESAIQIQ